MKSKFKDIIEKIKEAKWRWEWTFSQKKLYNYGQKESLNGNHGERRRGGEYKHTDDGTTLLHRWAPQR